MNKVGFILILAFLSLTSFKTSSFVLRDNVSKGACQCGLFDTPQLEGTEKPILAKNYVNVTCDTTGKRNCLNLCTNLALAFKEAAPKMICVHTDCLYNKTVSLFAQVCDDEWLYANVTSSQPICCHEKNVVACDVEKKMHTSLY